MKVEVYDLIILGAGSAGVSAALYARARGMKTALIEQAEVGGLIGTVSKVSHYAGLLLEETGCSFAGRLKAQIKDCGCDFINEKAISSELCGSIKKIVTDMGEYRSKSVILASGSSPKPLDAENPGSLTIYYEAWPHSGEAKDREIFVAGGSDGAAKEALYLSQFASKVHMIQIQDKLMTVDEFKTRISHTANIEVHTSSEIVLISGSDKITHVEIKDNSSGSIASYESENSFCVFAFIGQMPNNACFDKKLILDCGYIRTSNDVDTNIPGVFAAGDIRVKTVRQVSTAVNDGTLAAIKAFQYNHG